MGKDRMISGLMDLLIQTYEESCHSIQVCVCVRERESVCVYVCVFMCTYMCTHMYYMYTNTHTHMSVCVCVHTCVRNKQIKTHTHIL
jgi:hypothetical protein